MMLHAAEIFFGLENNLLLGSVVFLELIISCFGGGV